MSASRLRLRRRPSAAEDRASSGPRTEPRARRALINGRYELDKQPIARGGMGEVWAGRDIRLDRPVAVKVTRFRDGEPPEDFTQRFVRESRLMARIDHPGVPAVYDVGSIDGRPFLVMQRINGVTLADLIAARGPLPIDAAAAVAAQLCAVLAAAHSVSLVHRDLKPSNVMVEYVGGAKLLDFGLALDRGDPCATRITQAGQPIGSPAYMAPEQIVDGDSSPQSDLYALGCTLHEMLCGEPLFAGSTSYSVMSKQVTQPPPALRNVRLDVPRELDRLLLSLLEKRQEDRPGSAEAVYGQLLPFVVASGPLRTTARSGRLDPAQMYAGVLDVVAAWHGSPAGAAPAANQGQSVRRRFTR